jgi:hypothetical protein
MLTDGEAGTAHADWASKHENDKLKLPLLHVVLQAKGAQEGKGRKGL